MRPLLVLALTTALAACRHTAELPSDTPPDLSEPTSKTNYSVGYQVGSDFRRQGVEIRPELVVQGIQDALSGAPTRMSPQTMQETMAALGQRSAKQAEREREAARAEARAEARQRDAAFLAANARGDGVKTTASGLQYRVLTEGNGRRPGPTDAVTVHYRGTLTDGTEFDSSYRRGEPTSLRVDGVIAGWQEALQLMHEGAKWELCIPNKLAYGDRGPLAGRALIFQVELLSVE